MPDKFPSGISGGQQRSDYPCLPLYRVTDGNRKDKCDDDNHNIKKKHHHGLIASHILPGKGNRLILILRDIFPQICQRIQPGAERFCLILFCFFVRGRIVPDPAVLQHRFIRKGGKRLLRQNCHAEFHRVEDCITVILEQRAVIREGDQAGDRPCLPVLCFYNIPGL